MHLLVLYCRFTILYFKSIIEYRAAVLIDIVMQFTIFGSAMALIWVIATRFQFVGGWSWNELLFLYNLNMVAYGLAGFIFWAPMQEMDRAVRQGTFDSMLIYPVNPIIHLCFRNIAHQNVGNLILGSGIFVYLFNRLPIIWTFPKVLWFALVIIGTSLIQLALMILVAASTFWLKRSNEIINITFQGVKNFVDYPVKIYNGWIQFLLTFIVPYAFVSYYPAQYFLNKSGDYLFHPALQFATPLVGLLFVAFAYQVWKVGMRKYESAGS